MDEREPDLGEDARRQGTGTGGYPESNPQEQAPGEGTSVGGDADEAAPDTSAPEEGDPGQATGNPDAAG